MRTVSIGFCSRLVVKRDHNRSATTTRAVAKKKSHILVSLSSFHSISFWSLCFMCKFGLLIVICFMHESEVFFFHRVLFSLLFLLVSWYFGLTHVYICTAHRTPFMHWWHFLRKKIRSKFTVHKNVSFPLFFLSLSLCLVWVCVCVRWHRVRATNQFLFIFGYLDVLIFPSVRLNQQAADEETIWQCTLIFDLQSSDFN